MSNKSLSIIKSVLFFCLAAVIIVVPLKGVSVQSLKPAVISPVPQSESLLAQPTSPLTAQFNEFQTSAPPQPPPQSTARVPAPQAAKVQSEGPQLDQQNRQSLAQQPVAKAYVPRQEVVLADPSNYGDRYLTDAYGKPVYNNFIVVLHETVGDAWSAINYFQVYHARDADQASYHAIVERDGTIVYTVPPEKRAYGAGNSIFKGPNGPEAVITNKKFPPSVNNFAYHISLETPSDGRGNGSSHSGYTEAQYRSLAWLIAQTTIPENRITTHRAVDRSTSRIDPRSFNRDRLLKHLRYYSRQVG